MKIIIEKQDILYAVSAVEKAISGKNTMNALGGIFMEAKGNQVQFKASDMEFAIQCTVKATIKEEGVALPPGRKLSALVRLLPDCPVVISSDGQHLTVTYSGASVDLPCFLPEEFPMLPDVRDDVTGTISVAQLRRYVKQSSVATAGDEVRAVFTGVFTEIREGNLTMVATDTHRLTRVLGHWNGHGEKNINIPVKVLSEVCRLAGDDDDVITMSCGGNQLFFIFRDLLLTTRLIVGQYPDYRQVIPAEELYCTEVIFDKRTLGESLERAALIAGRGGSKASTIRLVLGEETVHIIAEVPDEGKIDEEIPAEISGTRMTVGYNVKYVLDALKVLDSDAVKVRLTGQNTPGIIVAAEGGEDYLYLLLPIRTAH